MTNLIFEYGTHRFVRRIKGNVSIGRAPENRVVVHDRDILANHARIYCDGACCYIEDLSGGKATKLNGHNVAGSHLLKLGDQLSLGKLQITVVADADEAQVPPDAGGSLSKSTDHSPKQARKLTFTCSCGARLRANIRLAGREGKCKKCGRRVQIPHTDVEASPVTVVAEVVDDWQRGEVTTGESEAQDVQELCSICQSPIYPDDDHIECSVCGLPFHKECWTENLGCSAYGCANVDLLKQGPDIEIGPMAAGVTDPPMPALTGQSGVRVPEGEGIPWEFVLMGASALAAVTGCLSFGLPPLLVAAMLGAYVNNTSRNVNKVIATVGFILCGLGFVIGIVFSLLFYQAAT